MLNIPAWFEYSTYMQNKLNSLITTGKPMAYAAAVDAMVNRYEMESFTMSELVRVMKLCGYAGKEGAYQHFLDHGSEEDVSPNHLFIPDYYYTSKAYQEYATKEKPNSTADNPQYYTVKEITANLREFKAAIKNKILTGTNKSAWNHYINYGTAEFINPSPFFNTKAYLNAKAEALGGSATAASVADDLKAKGLNALQHCMLYAGDIFNPNPNNIEVVAWVDYMHTVPVTRIITNSDPMYYREYY